MKNTCKIFKSKMFTLVCCNFSKSQGGKFKQKNNQLFSWLKKEGKTEASACLIDWPVGPVSAIQDAPWQREQGVLKFQM